ncbi:MAG: hypothetical protein ACT4O3_05005 [Elusimicrobiota bacterium]
MALAFLLAGGGGAAVAEEAVSTIKTTDILVTPGVITLNQTQTFQGAALADLWSRVDTDKNGEISPQEETTFSQNLAPLFTERCTLSVDWEPRPIQSIQVTARGLPKRKPKDFSRTASVNVVFSVSCPYVPAKANVLDFKVNRAEDQEVITRFQLDPSFTVLRANTGEADKGSTRSWIMTRAAGKPKNFSIIVHKTTDAADVFPGGRDNGASPGNNLR